MTVGLSGYVSVVRGAGWVKEVPMVVKLYGPEEIALGVTEVDPGHKRERISRSQVSFFFFSPHVSVLLSVWRLLFTGLRLKSDAGSSLFSYFTVTAPFKSKFCLAESCGHFKQHKNNCNGVLRHINMIKVVELDAKGHILEHAMTCQGHHEKSQLPDRKLLSLLICQVCLSGS